MTHDTWLRGADILVDEYQAKLALTLDAIIGAAGQRIAESETTRMALRELVSATRANFPKQKCQRSLTAQAGDVGRGPAVSALLDDLQEAALVTDGDRDTVIPEPPVNPIEQNVAEDHPTNPMRARPSMGPPTMGPWGDGQPTKPVKPQGRK